MFQIPTVNGGSELSNPSSDLRDALRLIPVKARDVRSEHFERLSALGIRPHVKNELRELVERNAWRARRPERLCAALPLLMELARLEKLTVAEGRHSGCKLPHSWNLRTLDGFSYATHLSAEMKSRAVILACVGPLLEIERDVRDLCRDINWHVDAIARARVDGRPLITAIGWANPVLGVVADPAVLDELVSIVTAKSKKDAGRVTFA